MPRKPTTTIETDKVETNVETTKAIKKKRNWIPNKQEHFGEENVKKGDNTRYLRYALASWDLPPIDISDAKQVEGRIQEYFQFCLDNDKKPSKVEMYNWIGVHVSTIDSWRKHECRSLEHSEAIRKADAVFHALWLDYMQNGKVNPASGIFLGKNQFGYRDAYDITPTPAPPLGEEVSQEALEAKLGDVVIDEE